MKHAVLRPTQSDQFSLSWGRHRSIAFFEQHGHEEPPLGRPDIGEIGHSVLIGHIRVELTGPPWDRRGRAHPAQPEKPLLARLRHRLFQAAAINHNELASVPADEALLDKRLNYPADHLPRSRDEACDFFRAGVY